MIAVVLAGLTLAPAQAQVSGRSTLEQTLRGPDPDSGFAQLSEGGPGEAHTVLEDLAKAQSGRETRRTSLSYFGQLSDYQLADEESPGRVEFLDSASSLTSSAFRPQEALVPHETDASIRQMNSFATSPVAQRDGAKAQMSHTVLTGDLADSQQLNETQWVRTLLDGGTLDPNSGTNENTVCPQEGATPKYTGVQDYDDYGAVPPSSDFYDPEDPTPYGNGQFPEYPGLLDRAQQPFETPGLDAPAYIAPGNHDSLVQGNQAASAAFDAAVTGCIKGIATLPPLSRAARRAQTRREWQSITSRGLVDGLPRFDHQLNTIARAGASAAAAPVPPAGTALTPPDSRRRYVNSPQYKQVFQDGPSPDGHGFDLVDPAENQASRNAAAYYSFAPKAGVRFISVDSVSQGGVTPASSEGNVDDPQFKWITAALDKAKAANELVVLFAHHSIGSQRADVPDEAAPPCTVNDAHGHDVNPGCDLDPRNSAPIHLGEDFKNLLLKYPNVVAFVAGHSHENSVKSYKNADGKSGFWEIKSPAVADWPTQSRLIEIMDNDDGTLSIFGTMLDFGAPVDNPPPGTSAASFSREQLAAIGRTITYNDPQVGPGTTAQPGPEGRTRDRNVELLIGDPRTTAAGTPIAGEDDPSPGPSGSGQDDTGDGDGTAGTRRAIPRAPPAGPTTATCRSPASPWLPSWCSDCCWRWAVGWRGGGSGEGLCDEPAVALVGEPLLRLAGLQPSKLVDLVVGLERDLRLDLHRPVAHDLGAVLVVPVAGLAELRSQTAGQAGLLLDLPDRRFLERLARVELALGQGPVVVLGAVDQDHQAVLDGHPARGLDLLAHRAGRLSLLLRRRPVVCARTWGGAGCGCAGWVTTRCTSAPPGVNWTRRIWQSGASARRDSIRAPVCCQWAQNRTLGPAPEMLAPTAPKSPARSRSSIERGYSAARRGWWIRSERPRPIREKSSRARPRTSREACATLWTASVTGTSAGMAARASTVGTGSGGMASRPSSPGGGSSRVTPSASQITNPPSSAAAALSGWPSSSRASSNTGASSSYMWSAAARPATVAAALEPSPAPTGISERM